jgi:hypothetical protein
MIIFLDIDGWDSLVNFVSSSLGLNVIDTLGLSELVTVGRVEPLNA